MTWPSPIPLSPAVNVEDCHKDVEGACLSGKNVLITGGASGVGAAIAQTYAEKDAYINIVDINKDLGTELAYALQARGHHVQFLHTDITSWPSQVSAFKAAIRFHPRRTLDIVVACAGVLGTPFALPSDPTASVSLLNDDDPPLPPPPPDTTPYAVNTIGLTHTAKLAQLSFELPHQTTTSSTKSLIIVTSMLAYVDFHNAATYTASKHAARGLFRILRPLLAARGHRVNALAPWLTRTPMTDGRRGGGEGPDLVGLFEQVGCPVAPGPEWAVRACLMVEERGLNGRVLAAGPDRVFDMQDDAEGNHGAKGLEYFDREVIPGWDDYVEKMRLIVEGDPASG